MSRSYTLSTGALAQRRAAAAVTAARGRKTWRTVRMEVRAARRLRAAAAARHITTSAIILADVRK